MSKAPSLATVTGESLGSIGKAVDLLIPISQATTMLFPVLPIKLTKIAIPQLLKLASALHSECRVIS